MVEPFWNYCRDALIVVTASNKWVMPTEASLASKDVQSLLDTPKLKEMTGKEHYVHLDVKEHVFLREIGVEDFKDQRILDALL